ncbi:hypothetical protein MXB_4752 [Myxobolus squamalis]|nr:hypothetical protein MXB_4752 [Myxobolus squamalis]
MVLDRKNTKEKDIEHVFDLFAASQDRTIFSHELGNVLRILGRIPSEKELQEQCELHPNSENKISLDSVKEMLKTTFRAEKVKDLKKWTDFLTHNDKISLSELRFVLTNLNEKVDSSDIQSLFKTFFMDDPSGIVDQNTFVKCFQDSD